MVADDRISKLANLYHQKAVVSQRNKFAQYANATVSKMKGLADGGVIATNHLLNNPKYHTSPGLSILKQKLPEVSRMLSSFNPNNDNFYTSLQSALEGMTFYTSPGNAGTGYDPVTAISDSGYTAPAYYVQNIKNLFDTLKGQRVIELDEPQQTIQDPIAKSLIQQQNKAKVKSV